LCVGPGTVGTCLAKAFASKGHPIIFASRDPTSAKIKQLLAEIKGSTADSIQNAVKEGDLIFLTTPWSGTEEAIKNAGDLTGKIVVDCTNPLGPNLTYRRNRICDLTIPRITVGTTSSGGEEVAKWAVGAKVVKAFNTIGCEHYTNPQFGAEKADLYVCSNDADAKRLVMGLAAELGFEPVDV
jgi:predicted dinucleotide-binding enzyme